LVVDCLLSFCHIETMTDALDRLLAESLTLPANQRARLAHRLIVSLDESEGDDGAAALWGAEIERRSREIDDGSAELLSWDAVRETIAGYFKAK
jgi:putative addiction module component (TIGR02574 family)